MDAQVASNESIDHSTSQEQGSASPHGAGSDDSARATPEPDAAAHATEQLAEATSRIASLSAQLEGESMARRLREAMEDAGAVRVRDAVRAAQGALAQGADAAAIAREVDRVRLAHPEFFTQTRWASTNAPAARGERADDERVNQLAARARATNDRRALLEYLRARRAK